MQNVAVNAGPILTAAVRRNALLGCLSGVLCGPLVWLLTGRVCVWTIVVAIVAGILFAFASSDNSGSLFADVVGAATLAIPVWLVVDIIGEPLARGARPAWNSAELHALLPALGAWVCFGGAAGAMLHLARRLVPVEVRAPVPDAVPHRIVIVGGGFGGLTAARELETLLRGAEGSVEITLVSDGNALLFTPMLAEVAGSSIEPTHISSPLRSSLRRPRVVRARVTGVDFNARSIEIEPAGSVAMPRTLPYDQLILALGSVSNFFGQTRIENVALDFKSLADAIRIRNHVIALFERADAEPDASVRRALLTFVIAGGGFAGIELAGALNDFARGIVADYMRLRSEDVSVVVVHSRERILPELSASLAAYARERMAERGVQFRLETRVTDAGPGVVILGPDRIATHTLVWTAGTAPNPLLATLDVERDGRGALVVDSALAVAGHAGVWALGDCAAIPNARTGGTYPPTAQHALREAVTVARNVRATLRNEPRERFAFESLGSLCVIGYQTACAEIRPPFSRRTVRFAGVFAWLVWRAVYLSKLPGFDRKVRVMVDWTTELFFPRDIVQTLEMP